MNNTARVRTQAPLKVEVIGFFNGEFEERRKEEKWKEEEKEEEEEGNAQKSEMVVEMQRAHHKSVNDGNEDRPKEEGRQKG